MLLVGDLHRTLGNIKPVLWNLEPVDTPEHFLVDCFPKLIMMFTENYS